MSKATQIKRIKSKLPANFAFPKELDEFLLADHRIEIGWTSLKDYEFKKSTERELIPFINVGDGSLVAIWVSVDPAVVVYVDAHGEPLKVIASGIHEFLSLLNAGKTGIEGLDDSDLIGIKRQKSSIRKPAKAILKPIQNQLDEWARRQSALQPSTVSTETENLRKKIMEVAQEMLRDGRCKVYTLKSVWWDMYYKINITSNIHIEYLDYGQWYPVPDEYGLTELVSHLLKFVKHPNKKLFDLHVCEPGIVSVDKDKELVLEAPTACP